MVSLDTYDGTNIYILYTTVESKKDINKYIDANRKENGPILGS